MNRVMLRTLVIANKWLDRCWNSEQHDRIYEMADGGFTVHEIAISVVRMLPSYANDKCIKCQTMKQLCKEFVPKRRKKTSFSL